MTKRDLKTEIKRREIYELDRLQAIHKDYPEWNGFLAKLNGTAAYDFEEELILEDDTIEARVLSPKQASKLINKAGGNGNGNGTYKGSLIPYSSPETSTQRYVDLYKSLEKRRLEQADTVILDQKGNMILV